MIVDCIADLHGHYPKLEGGDLLVVAGDLTAGDSRKEYDQFADWLEAQSYKQKIFIAGNHDNFLEQEIKKIPFTGGMGKCDKEKVFLCDSGVKWEGLKIWGSPWTTRFEGMNPHCMAFTVDSEDQLADKFASIPSDVDILITHSPPYTILDEVDRVTKWGTKQISVGSHYLRGGLEYCFRPKLWVFGHIHEAYGQETFKEMTLCVNASHVNELYQPVNAPVRIVL